MYVFVLMYFIAMFAIIAGVFLYTKHFVSFTAALLAQ